MQRPRLPQWPQWMAGQASRGRGPSSEREATTSTPKIMRRRIRVEAKGLVPRTKSKMDCTMELLVREEMNGRPARYRLRGLKPRALGKQRAEG